MNNIPFPIEHFPPLIQDAANEIQKNVKAPLPLIISSMFGVMSLTSQELIDVNYYDQLISPVGVFMGTIAESGERKSAVDRIVMKPVVDFEKDCLDINKIDMDTYNAELSAWEIQRKAFVQGIYKCQINNELEEVEKLKKQLIEHNAKKPKAQKYPRLTMQDISFEELARHYSEVWDSAGIMSDEGGQVLFSRSFNQSPMLNKLWDGGRISIDRVSRKSISLTDARLTISIMVQKETIDAYFKAKGQFVRGNGFLARFLISFPDSNQGFRQIDVDDLLVSRKYIERFQDRITKILELTYERRFNDSPEREILRFSPDAQKTWIEWTNYFESQIAPNGYYRDVKDAVSKIGNNAARIAALFHYFDGQVGDIQARYVFSAFKIGEWYLNEFKKIFQAPQSIDHTKAVELDRWMRQQYENGICCFLKNFILQYGPSKTRNKADLDKALETLIMNGNIRIQREPKGRKYIVYLPSLPFEESPTNHRIDRGIEGAIMPLGQNPLFVDGNSHLTREQVI